MAVIVEDTFTETAATALADHVPSPTGTGWTNEEDPSVVAVTINAAQDRVVPSSTNNTRVLYSAQPNPAVNGYDVEVTAGGIDTSAVADNPVFLIGRYTDASNYYSAGRYAANAAADRKIFKKVTGTVTELASGDGGNTAGDILKFEVRDATKKLYGNGVEELSTTDDALMSAGKAGIGWGDAWATGDDIAGTWSMDDFKVTEVDAPPPGVLGSKLALQGVGV